MDDTLALVTESLHRWSLPEPLSVRLINVSENRTYQIDGPNGFKAILRVHRPNYHTKHAIECELGWLQRLSNDGIVETPGVFLGCDGQSIQYTPDQSRYLVLFHFIDGHEPEPTPEGFEVLGRMAARMHDHTQSTALPVGFERLVWDDATVFGPNATWGDWRAAPGVTADIRHLLERAERTIRARLASFGRSRDRYGLIHADMRLANLLISSSGTRLIDFDDCGFGWFLYDFAAAISFIETDPAIPTYRAAWLQGYRKERPLSREEESELDTFIMLRRMALLAWIGSHIEAPEPQQLAPYFASGTATLANAYLARFST